MLKDYTFQPIYLSADPDNFKMEGGSKSNQIVLFKVEITITHNISSSELLNRLKGGPE